MLQIPMDEYRHNFPYAIRNIMLEVIFNSRITSPKEETGVHYITLLNKSNKTCIFNVSN